MSDRPFLKHIAYLQVIGILLVVFGHSFHEYPDGTNGTNWLVYRLMFNVRMPLFTFVSGYLMCYTARTSVGPLHFVRGKARRLLLPFLVLSLLTFAPRVLLSAWADDGVAFSTEALLRSLLFEDDLVVPYFWFLQMSFVLLSANYFLYYFLRTRPRVLVAALLALVGLFGVLPFVDVDYPSFFSLREVVRLGAYFELGVLYSLATPKIDRCLRLDHSAALLLFGAVWLALFLTTEDTYGEKLASVLGIGMAIALAKLLERRGITVLDHLIGTNYMIFLLSWYFNVATQQVLHQFTDFPWWVYSFLSFTLGIYGPWAICRWLRARKCRRILFLLGQKN
ncbi:MAG: acyltransferase family protein [Bacteroidaceae bacterium]|nr:acyltransferase family protein [Bacteroidaceae bacterium]